MTMEARRTTQQEEEFIHAIQEFIGTIAQQLNLTSASILAVTGQAVGVLFNRVIVGSRTMCECYNKPFPDDFEAKMREVITTNFEDGILSDKPNDDVTAQFLKATFVLQQRTAAGDPNAPTH